MLQSHHMAISHRVSTFDRVQLICSHQTLPLDLWQITARLVHFSIKIQWRPKQIISGPDLHILLLSLALELVLA